MPFGRFLGLAFAAGLWFAASGAAAARPAPDSFSEVVQRQSPAVVNISTTQSVQGRPSAAPALPEAPAGSPLAGYLGRQKERLTGGQGSSDGQSLGSGFIVDPAGYIVTNQHVIAGAQVIVVTLHDGQKLAASLIGADSKTDLAVLKVTPRAPLPFAAFGDSDKTHVGDWVVVIGNPYGLGGSVSAGIVSARNRELNLGSYDDFIQTDAAINSGNSGGPLFNLDGQVIGINSALLSPSGGSVGIGFAISANLARPVIAQLRSYGEARRGWIGVRVQTITPDIADSLALTSTRGALISNVTPDGPAERAGLRAGDIVLKFDGKDISDMRSFPRTVAESPVDRAAPIEIVRRGKSMTLQVSVQRLVESGARVASMNGATAFPAAVRPKAPGTGMMWTELTPDIRLKHRLPKTAQGVLVTAVEPGGPADGLDIRPGDLIVEAGQTPVTDSAALQAQITLAQRAKRRAILLGVARGADLSFKAVRLPGV